MRKKRNSFFLFFMIFAMAFTMVPSSVFATRFQPEESTWTDDEKPKQKTVSFPVKDGVGKEIGSIVLKTPYSIKDSYDYSFTLYRKEKDIVLFLLLYDNNGNCVKCNM